MQRLRAAIIKSNGLWKKLSYITTIISGGFLIFLTFLVGADVTMRYLFKKPIYGASEATTLLLPWIVFLAISYTLAIGGHVRVTLITGRLPRKILIWTESLDCILGILFFGLLTCIGWLFFWESFVVRENLISIVSLPFYAGKFSLTFGVFVMTMQYILLLLRYWSEPKGKLPGGEVVGV